MTQIVDMAAFRGPTAQMVDLSKFTFWGPPQDMDFFYKQSTRTGQAWLRSIHGRTVSYNQLVQNGDFSDGTTGWVAAAGVSFSVSGKIATVTAAQSNVRAVGREIALIRNHKYFGATTITSSDSNAKQFDIAGVVFGTTSGTTRQRVAAVVTWSPGSGNWYLGVRDLAASDFQPFTVEEVVLVDLTQAGIADIITTPEQFEAWQMEQFGHKDYLGYTPGKLVSVNPTGVLTTGRNVWDEEWELGLYDRTTGQPRPSTNRIRSKNYIPIFPNTTYYFNTGSQSLFVLWYDANYDFIDSPAGFASRELTSPANAYYARIYTSTGVTTYNHDICINLSDPSFNGQYVPYNGHTLPLDFSEHFATGMNGLNGIYDEVVSDENGKFTDGEKRSGKVNAWELDWSKFSGKSRFYALFPSAKSYGVAMWNYNIISEIAPTRNADNNNTLAVGIYGKPSQVRLTIPGNDDTTVAQFKAMLESENVHLVFELDTPQHITFTDPSDAVYPVTEGGTEQVLPVNGSEPATGPLLGKVSYKQGRSAQ